MPLDPRPVHDREGALALVPLLTIAGLGEVETARALTSPDVYPQLSAADLAQMLADAFSKDVAALRAALAATGAYDDAAIEQALAPYLPPVDPPVDPPVNPDQPPIGCGGYYFGGHAALLPGLSDIDQIDYREATGGYNNSPNSLVDLNNTGFTWQALIRPTATGGMMPLAASRLSNGGQGRDGPWMLPGTSDNATRIALVDGQLQVERVCPQWQAGVPTNPQRVVIVGAPPLTEGVWTLLTVTVGYGGPVELYVDRARVGGGYMSPTPVWPKGWIFANDGMNGFVGEIAWVAMWKGVRSPDQIAATPRRFFTTDEITAWQAQGLGGYWPLVEAAGDKVPDKTAVGNRARLIVGAAPPSTSADGAAFDGRLYVRTFQNTQDRGTRFSGYQSNSLLSASSSGFTVEIDITLDSLSAADRPLFVIERVFREARAPGFRAGLADNDQVLRLSVKNGMPVLNVSAYAPTGGTTVATVAATRSLPVGRRTSLALTFSAGGPYAPQDWTIWMDGEAIGSGQSNAWAAWDFVWLFGGDAAAGFAGRLASVSLWGAVRTPDQLAATPKRRLTDAEVADAVALGLGGYWPFDALPTATVPDLTPAGNHGQLCRVLAPPLPEPAWVVSD
jgi:hypothetical protein